MSEKRESPFSGVYVKLKGDDVGLTHISNLPQKEYEDFLELIHQTRLVYITLMPNKVSQDKQKEE